MKEYLIFRLFGPIASWGEIAVGENRHSFSCPSKSAIMGLIAAALGYTRDEDEVHQKLSHSLGFAVQVWSSGLLLRDYHTIQTPSSKGKKIYATRKDELRDKLELNTILSSRDYRLDSLYDICIWNRKDFIPLIEIKNKLEKPFFPLYLGRKACVIASPLFSKIIEADNLFTSFSIYDKTLQEKFAKAEIPYFFKDKSLNGSIIEFLWEDESSGKYDQIRTRRDEVLSRKRWQFGERNEFYSVKEVK